MRSKLLIFLAALAVMFFLPLRINALSDISSTYESIIYDNDSGIDSVSCNAVVQSDDGYILIGTYTGLYRFDGSGFTLMDADKGINNVRTLFVDSLGRLWVGTNDNGAAVYENDGTISFYNKENGLSSNSVRCFTEDGDGCIYIGSTGTLDVIKADGNIHTASYDGDIVCVDSLSSDSNGNIAGVTNNGILFFIKDGKITKGSLNDESGFSFSCVYYDERDLCLAGTSGSSVYQCFISDNEVRAREMVSVSDVKGIYSIKSDGDNGLWICADTGIAHLNSNNKAEVIYNDYFNSNISDVIMDYQGNYWFTSTRQGILKLSKNPFVNINTAAGISDGVVNSIEVINNLMYIGYDGGLQIINTHSNSAVSNTLTDMLDGERVRHIMRDSDSRLWISTYGSGGLICYDPSDTSIKAFNESDLGTMGNKFRFTEELDDGTILAASSTGLTFIKDGKVINTIGADNGLDMPQILCTVQLDDGTVLAGSDGDGIYVIKDGKVVSNIGEDEGLTSLVVMRIVRYKDVYFIVTSSALYILDAYGQVSKADSFVYSNNFDIIPDDDKGMLWITSSAGIFIVDGDELASDSCDSYTLLNSKSGLNTSLTANSWNYKDVNDNLYLCCSNGVRKISMHSYNTVTDGYKLAVNDITLDNGTVILPADDEDNAGLFVIPSDANRVSFSPVVLNYTLCDPQIYISLDGFDKTGIYTTQSKLGKVSFTNIPYGTYRFRLQILDEHTGLPIDEAVYTVVKEAQFYEQPVFKIYLCIICAAVIVFLTWVVTKIGSINIIKRQYEEIRIAKDEADRANNAKSQFLANVSHEIRTPINTILGMDEMILRENNDPQIQRYASDIKNSGATLLSIVNDILDISKIEAGQMNIVPDKYDITKMIKDLLSFSEIKAKEKNISFNYTIEPDLPRYLYGDEVRIKQVITNLLSNAFKYTEKGSVTLSVHYAELDNDDIALSVAVSDTGMGIKEEDRQKMFAKFERLDEQRNHHIEGTGLGLSITQNLLELMGSDLKFITEYGTGSTFGFSVKQKKMSDEKAGGFDRSEVQSVKYSYAASFIAPKAEILAVDDNSMNLEVVRSLLKRTKVNVDTASSGKECLEKVKKHRYHIILLDHMMPEMDGIETFEKIRSEDNFCKDTPVIILTANAVSGSKNMYLSKGFDDYLSKPVEGNALERILVEHLPEELVQKVNFSCEKTAADFDFENINAETGLRYSGNNAAMYGNMLDIYFNNSTEITERLTDAFDSNDIKNYEIVVHSLKSTSLGIGAEKLSEEARLLEKAAKGNDFDYIKAHHKETMELYRSVLYEIQTHRCKAAHGENAGQAKLTKADCIEKLAQLENALSDFNTDDAEKILNELIDSEHSNVGINDLLIRLKEMFGDYQWDKAADFLKEELKKL